MKPIHAAMLLMLAPGLLWAAHDESPNAATLNAARAASKPVATLKAPATRRAVAPPARKAAPYRSSSRLKKTSRASGKVRTLPAAALPANAIIPPLKNGMARAKANVSADVQQTPFVLHDANLRWQFYSYP